MKPKTRFNKLTAWLLTLAMLMTFIPSFTLGVSAETITGTAGTVSYTIDEYGVMTISGSGTIPQGFDSSSYINPNYNQLVKRIVIEDGITGIGQQSLDTFYNLTSVSIAKTVTSIGQYAFCNERNLKTITYWGTSTFTTTNILNSSVTPTIYVKTDYGSTKMFGKTVTKILTDTSKECTVKFDMNGYGTQVDSQYVFNIDGYNKVTKPTDPSAPEVKFEGWYKDSEFNTAWNFDTDTVSDNTTIYAKWNTTPDHTVSFNMGSYGTAISDRGVVSGTLIAEPETPTDADALFLGWYKDSSFETPWDFASDTVASDTTLYAEWRLWYGTAPSTGDGSESSPFEIGTADELYWFADYYNNSGKLSSAYVILVDDITVNQNVLNADGTLNGDGSSFRVWQPIGNSSIRYVGTFDGQGHTISGLYFNNTDSSEGTYVGFIGRLGAGTVKNLEVADSYFKGYQNVGGIVGSGQSNTASYVENCKSSATVYASYQYAGGISGNYSTVKNSLFVGKVGGVKSVGAIYGSYQYAHISNCYYLTNCAQYDNGKVQYGIGTSQTNSNSTDGNNVNYFAVNTTQLASGEIAYKLQGAQEDDSVVVWGQQLTGENSDAYPTLGGPRVVLDTATGTYINSEEGSSHTRVRGYCCDEDYDEPVFVDESNCASLGLTSDYIGYYAISNYGQLYGFAKIVNGGDCEANAVLTDNIVANENVLKADGTLNGDEQSLWQWNPILTDGDVEAPEYADKYEGTFDGNNKYISGLYYNNSVGTVRGLFGYVGENGVVKNLGIVDSYFYGQRAVGAIAGYNFGNIENCYNEGTIKAYPKKSTGMMNESGYFGGIVGCNEGSIENCHNEGYVSGATAARWIGGICGTIEGGNLDKCYNTGTVDGTARVGGIVGEIYSSSVSNTYNTGDISSTSTSTSTTASVGGIAGVSNGNGVVVPEIKTSYNFGNVSAPAYVGGILGHTLKNPVVTNCYYLKDSAVDSNGSVDNGYGNALTLEQMTDDTNWKNNFAGFDITNVWSKNTNTASTLHLPKLDNNSPSVAPPHIHEWTYTANGDTITATCEADGCPDTDVKTIVISASDKEYDGEAVTATVTNTVDSTDYSASIVYEATSGSLTSGKPVNVGTYKASITLGEGDDAVTAYVTYEITAASISGATVYVAEGEYIYNGEEFEPDVSVALGRKTLTADDYDVSYSNNTNVGQATVTVTGKVNYKDSATGTFTIGQSASDFTATADKQSYTYGDDVKITVSGIEATGESPIARFALAPQTESDNTVAIYEGETQLTDPKTVSGNELVFTIENLSAGEHTLTAKFSGDGNMAGVDKSVTVNVAAATLTNVSVSQNGTLTYSGIGQTAEITTAATAVNDETVTFTYSTEENGTYTSDIPAFTTVGEYTVYFKANADNHNEASGSFTVKVDKATAAVKTAPEAKTLTYISDMQELVTGGEALTGAGIVYSLEKEGEYSADIPKGEAATTYTVWYKVKGDDNYDDSEAKSVTVNIAKKAITAQLTVTTKNYDKGVHATITATLPDVCEGDDVSVIGIMGRFEDANVGTNKNVVTDKTFMYIDGDDKDNYIINIPATATGTITKAGTPTITFPTASAITFGQTLENATLSITSNDYGTFAWVDTTVKPNAGTQGYTVKFTASEEAKANYEITDLEQSVSVAVNPAKVTMPVADTTSFTYNGNEQTYTVAENSLYTISGNKRTAADSHIVTVKLNDKANYTWDNNTTEDVTFTFTIAQKNISGAEITLGTALTYNGNEQTQTVTSVKIDGLDVTYDISGNTATNYNDGGYTLTVTGNENFTGTATKSWNIARKSVENATVGTFDAMAYTGNPQTPSATVTVDGLEATGTWSDVTNVADTTTFTASGNFIGTIADKETGMEKADAVITVNTTPIEKIYGETWELPTATTNFGAVTVDKTVAEMENAGTYTVTYTVAGTDNYNSDTKTVSVTINPKKIDEPAEDTTVFTYNESEQTYTVAENAAYTISNNKRADAGEQTVTVALNDKANYTWADGSTDDVTFTFNIARKKIADATLALDGALTYNGSEQTQNVTVTLEGFTVTYDVTDNKATNVNTEGNYTLKVTASGNFEGEKTLEWNIAKADHTIEGENIPTASRITRGNKLSASTITPAELKDAEENVLGTFAWLTPDDEMTETGDFVKQVKFTPTDTNNYNEKIFDVAVNVYRPSSGGGSNSNTTTTTTKNEDGSTTKVTENKATGTKTEVTTNPDGSTSTVETKKDGTVTTTEKDKDGNTTTTIEKPDGTSTTTEKNKDGSEKVTEEKADGTTVITENDTDGTKTVTTENADGSKTTEETKKDGTKVTTETNADGETTAEVEAKGETEVVIPVDNAEDVTSITVTDKDGKETEARFEVKDGGVAISVSGNCTAVVNKAAKKVFDDVHPVNHWAIADVDYVFAKGLMNGVSETHFAPNDNLTRAMLVTVLYRLEGEPRVSGITSFADLEKGQYYLDAVCWAQINGIVNGTTDTTFAPNDNITREQIAAIMHRYAQYKGYDVSVGENTNILSYDDFDNISEYAIASMQYACGSGLMKGKTTSTLNPLDNATRAEIAAILHRFIEANK